MPKTRSYWSDGGTHKSEGGNFRPIASHTTLAEAGGGLMSISFSLSFWPKACGDPDAWVSLFVIVVCCLLLYTTSKLSSSSSPSLFFSSLALIYTQTRIYYRKRERESEVRYRVIATAQIENEKPRKVAVRARAHTFRQPKRCRSKKEEAANGNCILPKRAANSELLADVHLLSEDDDEI